MRISVAYLKKRPTHLRSHGGSLSFDASPVSGVLPGPPPPDPSAPCGVPAEPAACGLLEVPDCCAVAAPACGGLAEVPGLPAVPGSCGSPLDWGFPVASEAMVRSPRYGDTVEGSD